MLVASLHLLIAVVGEGVANKQWRCDLRIGRCDPEGRQIITTIGNDLHAGWHIIACPSGRSGDDWVAVQKVEFRRHQRPHKRVDFLAFDNWLMHRLIVIGAQSNGRPGRCDNSVIVL